MSATFTHKLIKGKIAELIFDQMFREIDRFTIIPFGYESTLPEIAQSSHLVEYKYVLDQIRTSPDFAMVSHDKTEVFLVEVKYFHQYNEKEINEAAKKIHSKWRVIWLFVATPDGFYFDSCMNVINSNGKILPLSSTWISTQIQNEYLRVLREFIK